MLDTRSPGPNLEGEGSAEVEFPAWYTQGASCKIGVDGEKIDQRTNTGEFYSILWQSKDTGNC
jgi:hypothetical protein